MQVCPVWATATFTLNKTESLKVPFPENVGWGKHSLSPLNAFAFSSWLLLPCTIQKHPMTSAVVIPEKAILTLTSLLVKMWKYTKPLFQNFDNEPYLWPSFQSALFHLQAVSSGPPFSGLLLKILWKDGIRAFQRCMVSTSSPSARKSPLVERNYTDLP